MVTPCSTPPNALARPMPTLMGLPLEIRLKIWTYLHTMTTHTTLEMAPSGLVTATIPGNPSITNNPSAHIPISSLPEWLFMSPILRLNWQIRSEIARIISGQNVTLHLHGSPHRALRRLPFAIVPRTKTLTLTFDIYPLWDTPAEDPPRLAMRGGLSRAKQKEEIQQALWEEWGCKREDRLKMIRHGDWGEGDDQEVEDRRYKWMEVGKGFGFTEAVQVKFDRGERREWRRHWEGLARSFEGKIREHEEERAREASAREQGRQVEQEGRRADEVRLRERRLEAARGNGKVAALVQVMGRDWVGS